MDMEWSESIGKLSLSKQCAFYNSKYKVVNRTKNKSIDAGWRLLLEKLIPWKGWSRWIKPTHCRLLVWGLTDELRGSLDYQIGDYPLGFGRFEHSTST